MTSLVNVSSYVSPVPIPPVAPDFVFCNGAYGTHLVKVEASRAASLLPQGTTPVTYFIGDPVLGPLAANVSSRELERQEYRLPFIEIFGGVSIAVDVSGPVDINKITVVPNDIRGMAAYVASQCLGIAGWGGFVTKGIQGLVDFVTDPTSDIDYLRYPDSTAFLTVTVGNHQTSHAFPGEYDPEMAFVLRKAEMDALRRVQSPHQIAEIADRIRKFALAEARMRRLRTEVPWWGGWLTQGNGTSVANVQLANMNAEGFPALNASYHLGEIKCFTSTSLSKRVVLDDYYRTVDQILLREDAMIPRQWVLGPSRARSVIWEKNGCSVILTAEKSIRTQQPFPIILVAHVAASIAKKCITEVFSYRGGQAILLNDPGKPVVFVGGPPLNGDSPTAQI